MDFEEFLHLVQRSASLSCLAAYSKERDDGAARTAETPTPPEAAEVSTSAGSSGSGQTKTEPHRPSHDSTTSLLMSPSRLANLGSSHARSGSEKGKDPEPLKPTPPPGPRPDSATPKRPLSAHSRPGSAGAAGASAAPASPPRAAKEATFMFGDFQVAFDDIPAPRSTLERSTNSGSSDPAGIREGAALRRKSVALRHLQVDTAEEADLIAETRSGAGSTSSGDDGAFMYGDFILDVDGGPQQQPRSTSLGDRASAQQAPAHEEFVYGDFAQPSSMPRRAKKSIVKPRAASDDEPLRNYKLTVFGSTPSPSSLIVIDKDKLAVCNRTTKLTVLSTVTAQPLQLLWHEDSVLGIAAFHGRMLALCTANRFLCIFDIQAPKSPSVFLHSAPVTCANFSQNGRFVVTGSEDGTCSLWNAKTPSPSPLAQFAEHTGAITCIACQPHGESVASGSADGFCHVWVAYSVQITFSVRHPDPVLCLRFSPDDKLILTCSATEIIVTEVETGSKLYALPASSDKLGPKPKGRKAAPVLFTKCDLAPPGLPHHIVVACTDRLTRVYRILNVGTVFPVDLSPEVVSFPTRDVVTSMTWRGKFGMFLADEGGNVYQLDLAVASPVQE